MHKLAIIPNQSTLVLIINGKQLSFNHNPLNNSLSFRLKVKAKSNKGDAGLVLNSIPPMDRRPGYTGVTAQGQTSPSHSLLLLPIHLSKVGLKLVSW